MNSIRIERSVNKNEYNIGFVCLFEYLSLFFFFCFFARGIFDFGFREVYTDLIKTNADRNFQK